MELACLQKSTHTGSEKYIGLMSRGEKHYYTQEWAKALVEFAWTGNPGEAVFTCPGCSRQLAFELKGSQKCAIEFLWVCPLVGAMAGMAFLVALMMIFALFGPPAPANPAPSAHPSHLLEWSLAICPAIGIIWGAAIGWRRYRSAIFEPILKYSNFLLTDHKVHKVTINGETDAKPFRMYG